MDGIGRELKPRPMDQAQKASDPLTGRWPTLLLAPRTPPFGGYPPTLSVYSSYKATSITYQVGYVAIPPGRLPARRGPLVVRATF
jgi:hypothetical protein